MAVSFEPRLPTKISSTVENGDEITKTTLDHVRRILSDHDYLKHPAPDGVNNEKTSIVKGKPHVGQKNVQSDIQDHSGPCSSHDSKVEKAGELPNEGIQANDLCSLLDKFEAIGNSTSILTPATSPGRSESLCEPLSLKINSHVNATDLTPPTTPPIQEQSEQKHIQNDWKLPTKQKKETSKIPRKKNAVNKGKKNVVNKGTRKAEDLKHTTVNKKAKIPSVVSKKVQQKPAKVGIAEHAKQGIKLAERGNNASKRKCEDTIPDTVLGKKAKTHAENKNEIDIKLSENCQESKIVLPKTNIEANESSEMRVQETSVENSRNGVGESLYTENGSDVGHVIEGKSPKVNKDENMVEPQSNALEESLNGENFSNVGIVAEEKLPKVNNNKKDKAEQPSNPGVKESLNNENCSNAHDVTEKKLPQLNSNKDNEHNEVHNNNNNEIELNVNTCRTVYNNNLPNVEKTQNKKHLNDGHKDDDHKSKSRDIKKTSKRRTERYNEAYKDDRKKRKHRSRSTSTDEDSSEEKICNPRKSERYHESVKHSHDSTRRKEKYRKYSSRDDCDEESRHRKYDDHRHRKPQKYIRDIEHERKIDFRLGRSNIRDVAKEERRVIYVGGLPYGTTRDELWDRFRKFGPIEKVTVHLRVGERDNYGFVTFLEPEDARECVERGNSDPTEPQFNLCFGGRRQFCGGSYVDFDSSTSHIEELSETYGKVCDDLPEEDDFDSLLRMCQEGLGR